VVVDSTGTRNFENVDSALFECGDSNIKTITAPADGNDFIAMMADGLRSQLASQGIHVKPFNSTE